MLLNFASVGTLVKVYQQNNDFHKGKGINVYNTCIAPQAAYRSCRGAVHVTDRACVGPIGRRPSLRPHADL